MRARCLCLPSALTKQKFLRRPVPVYHDRLRPLLRLGELLLPICLLNRCASAPATSLFELLPRLAPWSRDLEKKEGHRHRSSLPHRRAATSDHPCRQPTLRRHSPSLGEARRPNCSPSRALGYMSRMAEVGPAPPLAAGCLRRAPTPVSPTKRLTE